MRISSYDRSIKMESDSIPVEMVLRPIGLIHTPYKTRGQAPRQGRLADDLCEIEVHERYIQGLKDLDMSHLIVLYWLDKADREKLTAVPPHDGREHGVFATRSPDRPNPIALDIVELQRIEGNRIIVRGMDALDGSILLDIKPYSPEIDCIQGARGGWQDSCSKKQ